MATLAIVLTAGVASWAGWVYLAEAVGWGVVTLPGVAIDFHLAWLIPISVDVYAFVATRAWQQRSLDPGTRRYGQCSALAALALSIAGNGAGHAAEAGVWTPNWIAVVVVAAIPPVMLFAALHLRTKRTQDQQQLRAREAALEEQRRTTATTAATDTETVASGASTEAGHERVATMEPVATEDTPRATQAKAAVVATPAKKTKASKGQGGQSAGRTAQQTKEAVYDAIAGERVLGHDVASRHVQVRIANQVGVSERTVRRRVDELRKQQDQEMATQTGGQ